MCHVSQKRGDISFENQYLKKIQPPMNHVIRAVSLVVEFSKNIDFQRRSDLFSETAESLFLLNPVQQPFSGAAGGRRG